MSFIDRLKTFIKKDMININAAIGVVRGFEWIKKF
jgi:hypothetical protein